MHSALKAQLTLVTFETNYLFPGPFTNLTFPSLLCNFTGPFHLCYATFAFPFCRNYRVLKVYPGITFTAESAIIQDTAEHQDVSQEKLRILSNIVFKTLNVIWDQYGTIFGIFFEDSCSSFQTHQSVSARWDPDNYSRLDHNYEKILYFLKEFPKSILFLRSPLLFFSWESSVYEIPQKSEFLRCYSSVFILVTFKSVVTK